MHLKWETGKTSGERAVDLEGWGKKSQRIGTSRGLWLLTAGPDWKMQREDKNQTWLGCAIVRVYKNLAAIDLQFTSIVQLCLTLCDPIDCSTPAFPVHHQLPELTQTHVHRVGDAIQPSHPLLSPSPSALNQSQHQGLFQWVISLHQVAKY